MLTDCCQDFLLAVLILRVRLICMFTPGTVEPHAACRMSWCCTRCIIPGMYLVFMKLQPDGGHILRNLNGYGSHHVMFFLLAIAPSPLTAGSKSMNTLYSSTYVLRPVLRLGPLKTAVPFRGQITQNLTGLSPKHDCSF